AAPRSDLPAQTCGSFVLPAPLADTPRTTGPACRAQGPAGPHRPELTGQNSPTQELLQARRQLEVAQVGRLVLLRADAERRAGRRRRGARRTATERTLHRLALLLGPLRRVARLALLRLLRRLGPAARLLAHAHAGTAGHRGHAARAHPPALGHLAHHLLRVVEPFEKLVDRRG